MKLFLFSYRPFRLLAMGDHWENQSPHTWEGFCSEGPGWRVKHLEFALPVLFSFFEFFGIQTFSTTRYLCARSYQGKTPKTDQNLGKTGRWNTTKQGTEKETKENCNTRRKNPDQPVGSPNNPTAGALGISALLAQGACNTRQRYSPKAHIGKIFLQAAQVIIQFRLKTPMISWYKKINEVLNRNQELEITIILHVPYCKYILFFHSNHHSI